MKKAVILALMALVLLGLGNGLGEQTKGVTGEITRTVVLDAGHGGIDPGVTGKLTGKKESDLNLSVTRKLKRLFEEAGVTVILTRETEEGLYDENEKNKKNADMRQRGQIIAESGADVMLSIHMNYIGDGRCRGAQVFYQDEADRKLAESIQSEIVKLQTENGRTAHIGNYYVLKAGSMPSVIVECGFLSNAGDEALLVDEEYQEKLARCIFEGTMAFWAEKGVA